MIHGWEDLCLGDFGDPAVPPHGTVGSWCQGMARCQHLSLALLQPGRGGLEMLKVTADVTFEVLKVTTVVQGLSKRGCQNVSPRGTSLSLVTGRSTAWSILRTWFPLERGLRYNPQLDSQETGEASQHSSLWHSFNYSPGKLCPAAWSQLAALPSPPPVLLAPVTLLGPPHHISCRVSHPG